MLNVNRIKSTVICHYYNEEWLLPHWIKHHMKMFDHGILVNYNSSDRSNEIIRNLVPHWEIIDSQNAMFDAELCDTEIMQVEERIIGWKMVLNVTEFLIVADLKTLIRKLQKQNLSYVRSRGFQINDTDSEINTPFDDNLSLLSQRHHGYADSWRNRILHNHIHGAYCIGRHYETPGLKKNPYSTVEHKNVPIVDDFYLFWYRFAPFEKQLPRKIQISSRIPATDIKKGFGWNHWDLNRDVLYERWKLETVKGKNLWEIPELFQVYHQMIKSE